MIDADDLLSLVRNYNPKTNEALIRAPTTMRGACTRAVPAFGRALFHPSRRRRRHPDRAAAGRRHDHHRAAARHDRGHQGHLFRDRRGIRHRRRRARGRGHEADQPGAVQPRDQAGRELPQALHGDVQGPAGDPGQAGRPSAQHAHHPPHAAREAGEEGARRWTSTRRWRPDGHAVDARRAGGPVVPRAQPRCARLDHPPLHHAAEGNRRRHPKITDDIERELEKARGRGRRVRPREKALSIWRKMQEKQLAFSRCRTSTGSASSPRPRTIATACWARSPALARGAGAVQGLHQPAQVERLPVDPHDGLGARRQAGGGADPHPPDARGGRGRRRRALVLPRRGAHRRTPLPSIPRAGCLEPDRTVRDRGGPRRVSRAREARDVFRPGLLLHAQGRRGEAAEGGDADRLRLRDPHADRAFLRRRASSTGCACRSGRGSRTASRSRS
jgi:hypothetical protein